jgi:hypothetical protein
MPKRSSKKPPADPNLAAHEVLKRLTASVEPPEPTKAERSAVAAMLGSRGGKKGGKARAKALSPERRVEIARKGAKARWAKKPPP